MYRDDGLGGEFYSLYGDQASVINITSLVYVDSNISNSVHYRYKYRARNVNGWGAFSTEVYLISAVVPSQPPKPRLKFVDDTKIELELFTSEITGGSDITEF